MNITKFYVVAGNKKEYDLYVSEKMSSGKGDNKKYIYVYRPDNLRGLSEISGVFIGTYANRKDIREIILYIGIRKSKSNIPMTPPEIIEIPNGIPNENKKNIYH